MALIEKIPGEIQQALAAVGGLATVCVAFLARILQHHRLVKGGHRRFWSWDLAWEAPTAVLCAVIGGGLAHFFNLDPLFQNGMAGLVGWLGPRGVEQLIVTFARRAGIKKGIGK